MPIATLADGSQFEVSKGVSILDSALMAGVQLEYSCKNGRCGVCAARVIDGETETLNSEVNPESAEAGKILTCCRGGLGDVSLDVHPLKLPPLPTPKVMPCKISELCFLNANLLKLSLRVPPSQSFSFLPGQYINLIKGDVRRSYSVASAPGDQSLGLIIKRYDGGLMSKFLFDEAQIGDLLRLDGPYGTFCLRDDPDVTPVFCVTGTGIAPVVSMISSEMHKERLSGATVYWGLRSVDDFFDPFADRDVSARIVPVYSRRPSGERTGLDYVHKELAVSGELSNESAVYACGAPEMIAELPGVLKNANFGHLPIFSDSFVQTN